MEFNEEQLRNVIAGAPKEVSEIVALKNDKLFREKKIRELNDKKSDLKKIKENIINNNYDDTVNSKQKM